MDTIMKVDKQSSANGCFRYDAQNNFKEESGVMEEN